MSTKHTPSAIDMSILDRVSEDQVKQWMLAKLLKIRAAGILVTSFDLNIWFWDRYRSEAEITANFRLHGPGGFTEGDKVMDAVAELRIKSASNPSEKAAKLRRKSRDLDHQAKKLDEQAAALRQPLDI